MQLKISPDIDGDERGNIMKKRIYPIIIMVCTMCIVGIIIYYNTATKEDKSSLAEVYENNAQDDKLFANVPKPQEVVTVNTEIIEDGLREMGTLITEEYYFTQVEEYTSTTKAWIIPSTASCTYSYDGTVSAGIDCNRITVDKDEEKKVIKITVPKSEIINVVIDHNSFKIYEEKNGLWNKLDMTKINNSLIEFEDAARQKALDKGIIDRADESAAKMIESFARSIADSDEYTIELVAG